uniref:Selenoprotein S n=1 Tax=Amphilophus citrinellus TaxID=61819 RepID=A0A3Q0T0T2_AMPCI
KAAQLHPLTIRGTEVDSHRFLSLQVSSDLSWSYGWYLLFGTVMLYLLILHLSKRRSSQRSPNPQETELDLWFFIMARRQEAMEAARRKMQEELDAKAAVFKEKHKLQEEEKRRQKIEMWESMQQGKSYKGATTEEASSSQTVLKPKTDKKPLRSTGTLTDDRRQID